MPSSRAAAEQLGQGHARADGADVARHVRLPEEASLFWLHGFFDAVNSACGSQLSEYQEELIGCGSLPKLRKVVKEQLQRFDGTRRAFLEQLLGATDLAERGGVPLVWVL